MTGVVGRHPDSDAAAPREGVDAGFPTGGTVAATAFGAAIAALIASPALLLEHTTALARPASDHRAA